MKIFYTLALSATLALLTFIANPVMASGDDFPGCTDPEACNYSFEAQFDDGSCNYLTCLCPAEGYTLAVLNMYDGYGDGWGGSVYTLTDQDGTIISSGSQDDAMEGDGSIGTDYICIPATEGCFTMSIDPGSYPEEIFWEILDANGTYLAAGGAFVDAGFTLGDAGCAGCTEPTACNYDSEASFNDDSCEFLSCTCPDGEGTAVVVYMSNGGFGFNNDNDNTLSASLGGGGGEPVDMAYTIYDADGNEMATGSLFESQAGDGAYYGSDYICLPGDGCYSVSVSSDYYYNYIELSQDDEIYLGGQYGPGNFGFSIGEAECAGCTNPQACNYVEGTTIDDDSCDYTSCICTDGEGTLMSAYLYDDNEVEGAFAFTISDAAGNVLYSGDLSSADEVHNYYSGTDYFCLPAFEGCFSLQVNGEPWSSHVDLYDINGNYVVGSNGGNPSGFSLGEADCTGCTNPQACNYTDGSTIENWTCEFASCVCPDENGTVITVYMSGQGGGGPKLNDNDDNSATLQGGGGTVENVHYTILDADGIVIFEGDLFGAMDGNGWNYGIDYFCFPFTDGCFTLVVEGNPAGSFIELYSGDGLIYVYATNDNVGFSIGETDCAGCTNEEACNFDPEAIVDNGSCDFTSCICTDENSTLLAINIYEDYYDATGENDNQLTAEGGGGSGENIFYYILDAAGNVIAEGDLYSAMEGDGNYWGVDYICLPYLEGCFSLVIEGGYGAYGELYYEGGGYIVGADMYSASGFSLGESDCYGCINSNACNYTEGATIGDGSCDFISCVCADEEGILVIVEFYDDYYYESEGVTYTITDIDGNIVATGDIANVDGGNGTSGGYNYHCLPSDGCLIITVEGNYMQIDFDIYDFDDNFFFEDSVNSQAYFSMGESVCGGCYDEVACNYNPDAPFNDYSCEYSTCGGCMDVTACNFNDTLTIENGTCEYISCSGCTEAEACNFDPNAIIDDGSCEYSEYMIPQVVGEGPAINGCELVEGYFWALQDCVESVIENNPTCLTEVWDSTCQNEYEGCLVQGCMDSDACNYNPDANVSNGSCEYESCIGCTDAMACNFNEEATQDDGSCEYETCLGCIDVAACNFDDSALIDDESCDYSCYGCTDVEACNFDEEATIDDESCEFETCAGCMDETACNYDEEAIIDDESCEFETCAGCMDETACNYDEEATIDNESCIFIEGSTLLLSDELSYCITPELDQILEIETEGGMGEMNVIVLDEEGNMVLITVETIIDLEEAEAGDYQILIINHDGNVDGLDVDLNIDDLLGCFELSNITNVSISTADAGSVTLDDDTTEITVVVDDSNADLLYFTYDSDSDNEYAFIMTDENDMIQSVMVDDNFNFEGSGIGINHIWGISYTGDLADEVGSSIDQLTSTECYHLSSNYVIVNKTIVDAIDEQNLGLISIYPNPSNGQLYISGLGTAQNTITLYDVTGKLVMQTITNSELETISIEHLESGAYLLEVLGAVGRTQHTVIKE